MEKTIVKALLKDKYVEAYLMSMTSNVNRLNVVDHLEDYLEVTFRVYLKNQEDVSQFVRPGSFAIIKL